ncbi:MAG: HEPN domain-containing protein [Candidatus Hodarchaeota archaeon]
MIKFSVIASRWFRQAEADLNAAKNSMKSKNYDWSCFQSQQAAEKAIKAFLYKRGYTSIITHSLRELIIEAEKKEKIFSDVKEAAKFLDMYYIPTRYPNGLAGNLAPFEFYEEEDANKCINYAESILILVRKLI